MLQSKTAVRIANNTIFQVMGKVVSMSVTILATILITRAYGREGYGEFNLMQNIPALFFIIVDFGMNAIATRELSKDFGKAEKYLGNILVFRIALSLLLMLIVGTSIYFFPYSDSLKFGIYISLFLILTQALYATTNIIFQVKLRYDYSTIGYVFGSVVILFFVLFLTYLKVNITWVNFSYVLGGLVTFLVNIYFVYRFIDLNIKLEFDKKLLSYLFVQSIPLGLMFIFSQISFKADSLMLSVFPVPAFIHLSNTEVVAVYGLPYKIFEVLLVVPTFLMNAVYPIYVRHMSEGATRLLATFKKTMLFLFFAGVVISLVGIVFSGLAVSVLGGEQFTQSKLVLQLLLVGIPIFYATQPISWLIVTLEKQKFLPPIYLISAIVNISLNMYLIPRYSFYASSIITWVSETIILVLLLIYVKKAWNQTYA